MQPYILVTNTPKSLTNLWNLAPRSEKVNSVLDKSIHKSLASLAYINFVKDEMGGRTATLDVSTS